MAEASSDVSPEIEERRAAIVISPDDVSELAEQLNDVAGKWELFLGLLKVSPAKQEQIKSSRANQPAYAQICLVDGLQHWVVSDPSPTVEKVIAALSSRTINNKLLAAEIARKWGIQAFVENPAPELRSICTAASELAITRPESQLLFDKLQAEAKSSELRDYFISLVGDLKQHLKETKTDVGLPKFRDEFILKLPLSVREDNEKFFNRNNTEINKAATFDELFTCLSTYWSYLNHSLLGGIILRYGTEELKDNIEEFSRKVDEFRKVTTIEVFQEIEPSPRVVPPAGFQEFVTKHALSLTSTLEDIECIRHEFCEKFHLHKFAFYLVRVLKGSVLITWLVPHSVARLLEAGMTQELKKALHIEDIMYIYGDKSGVKKDDATPFIEASTSVAISALAKATTLSKEDPPGEEKGQEHEFEHDNRKLDFADLTIGEKIGEGGFVTVFRGTVKGLIGVVAIKQVDAESSADELDYLCGLKHPNIIKLYGTASRDIHLYIVTELAGHGSLYGHIQKTRGQPDMELSVHWATGVARGMNYLHENYVVHRDLKSANVLLTSNKTAKLCDFGVSKWMDHTTKATMTGIYPWMAPEVINEAAYSKRCDLFSYGTVLWELVTHEVPFEELDGVPFHIQLAIVNGKMPAIPESVAGYLSELIQSCWDMDPHKRPSFVEVLSILAAKGTAEHQTQLTHAPLVARVEPAQAVAQEFYHDKLAVSLMASRGCQNESVQKIWKSKLTEHFDKIGKPLESAKIQYKTKETPKGGFQSKVFVPGLPYAQGDVQRSRSEAEHDAARKALNELDQ